MSSAEIFIIVTMGALIGYLLWSKRQAGSVLLKLGRSKTNKLFLGWGVVMILIAISDLVEAGIELTEVFGPLGMLLFGVSVLLLGWSGLEIREAGIFSDGQLLKWERIESYDFGEKTLIVTWKRRWYDLRTGFSYRVPPLQKDAVRDLLAQHVSGTTAQVEVV